MADYPALAAALARPEFDGLDDAALLPALRAARVEVGGPIAGAAVKKLWTEAGVLARAWVVANDPAASFAARWHCKAAYDAITGGTFADFNAADAGQLARMQVYFDRMMAAGPEDDRVLTLAQVEATLALAIAAVPLLEHIGWAILRDMDDESALAAVAAARNEGG